MLVDTSVWVDHLRRANADPSDLAARLTGGNVWCHPFVVGEIACGVLPRRHEALELLSALPRAAVAAHEEVLDFVESNRLAGRSIGWVGAHLLASASLSGIGLWTLDARLAAAARTVQVPPGP